MAVSRKKAHVARVSELAPSVRGLALEVADGPLDFVAGQWVNVEAPTVRGMEKRAYSIASAPGANLLELAVTLVPEGALSPSLHALPQGAEVSVDGPQGFFTREGPLRDSPTLLVATGTGLAPFRSMLLAAGGQAANRAPITVLFGCRTEEDILWRSEFDELARTGDIRFEVSLSRPGAGWQGRRGYVQSHVAELASALGQPHVFICGLNRMVSEVRAVCKGELGYPRTSIHSERYD
jgi:CDP-4-dehydro-6-deoxyglucose reductase